MIAFREFVGKRGKNTRTQSHGDRKPWFYSTPASTPVVCPSEEMYRELSSSAFCRVIPCMCCSVLNVDITLSRMNLTSTNVPEKCILFLTGIQANGSGNYPPQSLFSLLPFQDHSFPSFSVTYHNTTRKSLHTKPFSSVIEVCLCVALCSRHFEMQSKRRVVSVCVCVCLSLSI